MILVDAGPIVALVHRDDRNHSGLEQPDEFNRALLDFLDEVTGRRARCSA